MSVKRSLAASNQNQIAKLRVRRRQKHWHALLPALRLIAVFSLIAAVIYNGVVWVLGPRHVGALDFTPHTIAQFTNSQGIAIADFNRDGREDLVIAGLGGVRVYENKGNFNFQTHIIDDKQAERVQAAQLNDDDELDLLITYKGSSPSVRWFEKSSSGFDFTTHELGTTHADAKAYAGDIDGDGAIDIVTAGNSGGLIVLQRWMNNGSGTFTATALSSDSGVSAVVIGDVTNNGFQDIVTGGSRGLQRWTTANGSTWSRVDIDDNNGNKSDITILSPGDSKTWIATADSSTNEVALYRSGSADSYSQYGRLQLTTTVDAKSVTGADIDSDGDFDLLVAAQDDDAVYWFDNDGLDRFTKRTLAGDVSTVYDVAAADLDGDNDLDVITQDFTRGSILVYERIIAKPKATAPNNITQTTNGTGIITFKTTLSDGDRDSTRIRIQYSTDGQHWYKPWLTKVTPSSGSVDLTNSNGYQIGTTNPIDTDSNDSVELTIQWDTKSSNNTGGPVSRDIGTVKLRLLPQDDRQTGSYIFSPNFRVDNKPPQGLGNVAITAITPNEATVTWDEPADSNSFVYKLYYGADHKSVLEQTSSLWDGSDDALMNDIETTTATIPKLTASTKYTFKLFAVDAFGNSVAAPSVQGTTIASGSKNISSPTLSPTPSPDTSPSPNPLNSPSPPFEFTPLPAITPIIEETLQPPAPPLTIDVPDNHPPLADAGPDQVVNPATLVALDGTASFDPDQDETASLQYSWRHLTGPPVELDADHTAAPTFIAGSAKATHIFKLTVKDKSGVSASDDVTVVVKEITITPQQAVQVEELPEPLPETVVPRFSRLQSYAHPLNVGFFALSIISTLILLSDRLKNVFKGTTGKVASSINVTGSPPDSGGIIVHYRTGQPITGAQVLIYGENGKLQFTRRTNTQGQFETLLPVGQYTLNVRTPGFMIASTVASIAGPSKSLIYTGGRLTVNDDKKPLALIIPLKPIEQTATATNVSFGRFWQRILKLSNVASWPLFLVGALLNTLLVFTATRPLYLALEVAYIILVIIKIGLEVKVRAAYGHIRDAITHIPLDLATVRFYDSNSNRLITTRVTNNQGKFFALPAPGLYTVSVSKSGYAPFTKSNVKIKSEHDATIQITIDLMPLIPKAGGSLAQARRALM